MSGHHGFPGFDAEDLEILALAASRRLITLDRIEASENLGRFEVLYELGAGTRGAMFKARAKGTGTVLALKIYYPSTGDCAAGLSRLLRAFKRGPIPGAPRLFEAGRAGRLHYAAWEYVEGVSAASLAESYGPDGMPERDALALGLGLAQILRNAQAAGLRPDRLNASDVLLTAAGGIWVTRWGTGTSSAGPLVAGVLKQVTRQFGKDALELLERMRSTPEVPWEYQMRRLHEALAMAASSTKVRRPFVPRTRVRKDAPVSIMDLAWAAAAGILAGLFIWQIGPHLNRPNRPVSRPAGPIGNWTAPEQVRDLAEQRAWEAFQEQAHQATWLVSEGRFADAVAVLDQFPKDLRSPTIRVEIRRLLLTWQKEYAKSPARIVAEIDRAVAEKNDDRTRELIDQLKAIGEREWAAALRIRMFQARRAEGEELVAELEFFEESTPEILIEMAALRRGAVQ